LGKVVEMKFDMTMVLLGTLVLIIGVYCGYVGIHDNQAIVAGVGGLAIVSGLYAIVEGFRE
jgi:uncharacterized membrane protein HdeD (DUF308 family)